MTWSYKNSSVAPEQSFEPDQPAPDHALAEIIERVRRLRSRAGYYDLKMLAYLLHMAEIEASDMLADAANQNVPEEE